MYKKLIRNHNKSKGEIDMKKILMSLFLLLGSFMLIGCGEEMTPNQAVDDYLQKYVTLDDDILKQIDEFVDNEDMTNEQKSTYKKILKDQYSTMTYTVKDVEYDEEKNDVAYVTVDINVRDLYKVQVFMEIIKMNLMMKMEIMILVNT